MTDFVYLIHDDFSKAYKIGVSSNPESRLANLQTTDSREWAKAFMETIKTHDLTITEDFMTTWFANAIMVGYDSAWQPIMELPI